MSPALLGVIAESVPKRTLSGIEEGGARISQRPKRGTLLVILAVGLLHYSTWKFVEAFKDPENVGKGLRVLYGASGFLHIYLAYMAAVAVLSGLGVMGGGKSGDQSAQSGTSWLMSQGFGRWLVGAVGVVAFGISISQLLVAYRAKFREKLALRDMHAWEKIAMITLGRMGFCARALLIALVGLFLVQAAVNADSDNAGGMAKALATLMEQPFGPWLLGATAAGLVAPRLVHLGHDALPRSGRGRMRGRSISRISAGNG